MLDSTFTLALIQFGIMDLYMLGGSFGVRYSDS